MNFPIKKGDSTELFIGRMAALYISKTQTSNFTNEDERELDTFDWRDVSYHLIRPVVSGISDGMKDKVIICLLMSFKASVYKLNSSTKTIPCRFI